ncbi:MAG: DegT/DnrJ/EryC1/StrS family aminotransferase [Myxococcales bacterium]|nr:DegT/DnrJ/EryC1/StrS family aminotransferase [Myxococcales bacterium]MCB9645354.1 DegT/DnrJ/EryC1/StrS family aminotransferase [Deltaproteobacteria bacterium]
MRVRMADLAALHGPLLPELQAAFQRVIQRGRYVLGPELEALEEALALRLGAAHAVGVASGTDALLLALGAAGVGPGGLVITTPYTFVSTAQAVTRLGATPVFVDVDPATLNLSPPAVRAWLDAHSELTPRVQAILPVHLFGRAADLPALEALAGPLGIPVIEDAAQALGAMDPAGRAAGSVGKLGCFSFFPTKNLGALGEAGLVATSDHEAAERVRRRRSHGGAPHRFDEIGGNHRLDELQAAALLTFLPHLERWNARRRAVAARYAEALGRSLTVPAEPAAPAVHVWHQYVVRVPGRDAVVAALAAAGVGTALYYPVPLHLQPCFQELGYRAGELPETERAAAETLALPIHPALSDEDVELVIAAVLAALEATA